MGKHVQYHCRGGCLAVRAADDDAQLVLRLLVKVFGIAVYLQPKLLGFKQFGIVSACVHTKNHSVEVGGDAFRVPAFFLGHQPCVLQTRAGRIEDFVVRACDGISFLVQRQCEVVHCTAADGYEVYFHIKECFASITTLVAYYCRTFCRMKKSCYICKNYYCYGKYSTR